MKNYFVIFLYRIILILSIVMPFKQVFSQAITYETSKALLIHQFTLNINWENEQNIKKYKIGFLENEAKTYNEFKKTIATNKIKGKPVELFRVKSIDKIPNVQLLYIDEKWSEKIEEIWFKIENRNILLVSEKSNDAKYIMLNIFLNPKEDKINFEINKANIIIENFSFDPELLLTGGKEVDIRELYREMKLGLVKEKQEVEQQKKIIKKQTEELATLHKQADILNINITLLLKQIAKSKAKLEFLSDSVKIQQEILSLKLIQIKEQEKKLKTQEREISIKENEIIKKENEIIKKENEISSRTIELDSILTEKNKQQDIINKQKNDISNQKNIINKKNWQLLLSVVLAFLLIVVAVFIYYAYRIRKKASIKQLAVSNKLGKQKRVLEKTLTKLKATQSQLIQSEKMASLGVLTAGIAHEINNPVNYINSGLEGLKTISTEIIKTVAKYQQITNGNEKKHEIEKQKIKKELEYLAEGIQTLTKNINKGVSRTTEIIKSLNTFSHTDDDELSLTNIHEGIDSTTTLLYNQYKNRIKIIKNYNKIPTIHCYSSKLNQVFMNILSNAIQAIEEKGTIIITTSQIDNLEKQNGEYVKISIKDTGKGIPENVQNKIFEPFFTTKQVGKGTGLGLSISHGIIQQHKGEIKFKSSTKGTEFEIYLPIISNHNKKATTQKMNN